MIGDPVYLVNPVCNGAFVEFEIIAGSGVALGARAGVSDSFLSYAQQAGTRLAMFRGLKERHLNEVQRNTVATHSDPLL